MHLKSTVSLLWPLQVAIMGAIATWFFFYIKLSTLCIHLEGT